MTISIAASASSPLPFVAAARKPTRTKRASRAPGGATGPKIHRELGPPVPPADDSPAALAAAARVAIGEYNQARSDLHAFRMSLPRTAVESDEDARRAHDSAIDRMAEAREAAIAAIERQAEMGGGSLVFTVGGEDSGTRLAAIVVGHEIYHVVTEGGCKYLRTMMA